MEKAKEGTLKVVSTNGEATKAKKRPGRWDQTVDADVAAAKKRAGEASTPTTWDKDEVNILK